MATNREPSVPLRVTASLFVAVAAALLFGAVALLRTRCEGFGCTGVGIVWLAWAFAYVPTLLCGIVVRGRLKGAPGWSAFITAAVISFALLGLSLLVYWAAHHAR